MTSQAASGPRYRIGEIIGRGGMGEVRLADDLMLDRQVALKFVNATGEADGLERVLGEARAAAALDHPFICSIYEVSSIEGRPCIAMEYVRGETLERRLRRGPLPLAEALRVAEEIAEALDAAHRRRVVHHDLKPANVILGEDGHVKVMDFGLATRLPQTVAIAPAEAGVTVEGREGVVRGTPAYMAPEQIRGQPADRRSDIFAFGVLLHELLSSVNPFIRVGVAATMAAILSEPVAPLHARQSEIPASLDVLLSQLLAKDAAARLQSFADVRGALRRVSVERAAASSHGAVLVAPAATDARATLIGRAAEQATLLDSLQQARNGRGGLVLLYGEAGSGKTRLAEEALCAARRLGLQTLTGRCSEQGGAPALTPYVEIAEEASRLMPAIAFRAAVGDGAPELARLVPALHRLLPDMAAPLELAPALQQRYLFSTIRDFFARCGQATPLAVLVDDMQWADESTLQLTQFLAPQLAMLPVVLIVACRDVETGRPLANGARLAAQYRESPSVGALTPEAVRAGLDRLAAQRHARAITLRPLATNEVQAMLAALGEPEPPVRLVRRFAAQTGGNPFFIAELFRQLTDEGRLFDDRRQWTRDLDFDDVALPDTVRVVIERQLERMSADTVRVLRAAAVIGRQFDPDLLEAVTEIDGDVVLAALDEAERARVLAGPSGRRDITWRFAHQLTRRILADATPHARRQRLHLRIADAMERLGGTSDTYASQVAHHLYSAGRLADPERTARALIAAGDAAHAVYAIDDAVEHYRRGLEVLEESGSAEASKLAAREVLADLLALRGDRADAMAHYLHVARAYRTAPAAVPQARIARKTAALHWQAGDRTEAMAAYQRALGVLRDAAAPIETALLYQELGLAAFRNGDNDGAVDWSERAVAEAGRGLADRAEGSAASRRAAAAAIAQATNTIGVALARRGDIAAARERIEQSLAAAEELGLLDVACRAYANLGVLYSSVEPKRAIEVSRAGLEVASKIGCASLQSYLYANLATAYCALTDRCETDGLEAARTAAALDRELGQLDHLAVPLIVIAQIHQCRGELQIAEATYREALALAERIGEPQLVLPCYDGLATIHLDRGDRVRAEEYLERASHLCQRNGLDPDTLLLLPFLC
jgi:adenylate cyclase